MTEEGSVADIARRLAPVRDDGPVPSAADAAPSPVRWKRIVGGAALVGVLGVAAALGWRQFAAPGSADKPAAVPLIRAEAAPIKVRPENPGGMEIPDRDKLVYGRLSTSNGPPPVERLLPEPEQPMPPPAPKPRTGTPKPMPATPSVEQVAAAKPPPAPDVSAPPPAQSKQVAAARGYRVQLAAVKSAARAADEWTQLRRAHGDVLGPLSDSVVRADLGAKGVFYRLRAGPLAGEAEAKAMCAELTARKVPCMVVRPGG